MAKARRRILIYRLGSLGDTIVALPALHLVRRAFPDEEGFDRLMLTNFPINQKAAAAAAILDGTGLLGGYVQYPLGARSLRVLVGLWWKLLRMRPEAVVYLAGPRGVGVARRDSNFFKLCGIFRQYGVPLTQQLQENVWQPEREAFEPECERLVRTIAALGDGRINDPASWELNLNAAERAKADAALAVADGRPMIAFSVGTKMPANDWGREKWRAMLRRLGEIYGDHAIFFTGVENENETSEAVVAGWRETAGAGSPVINLCGVLTPRESAACFARARIFIGHDSGPMHLAASVNTPVVAIFSARIAPSVWFPHGRRHRVVYHKVDCMGCELKVCTIQKMKCVTSIAVEEVVAEVGSLLN